MGSHYQDKMVVRPSYLYNENPYFGKTAFLYRDRPQECSGSCWNVLYMLSTSYVKNGSTYILDTFYNKCEMLSHGWQGSQTSNVCVSSLVPGKSGKINWTYVKRTSTKKYMTIHIIVFDTQAVNRRVQVKAWCLQAPGQYLNQGWPRQLDQDHWYVTLSLWNNS